MKHLTVSNAVSLHHTDSNAHISAMRASSSKSACSALESEFPSCKIDDTSSSAKSASEKSRIVAFDIGGKIVHYEEIPKQDGPGSTLNPVHKSKDGKRWVNSDGKTVADVDPYETYTGADGKEHFQSIVAFDVGGGQTSHFVKRPNESGEGYTLHPVHRSKDGRHWVMEDGTVVGNVHKHGKHAANSTTD